MTCRKVKSLEPRFQPQLFSCFLRPPLERQVGACGWRRRGLKSPGLGMGRNFCKAEPEGEIWAEGHFSDAPQGTGITAPTPEVLQAERQAMAGSACVYVCSKMVYGPCGVLGPRQGRRVEEGSGNYSPVIQSFNHLNLPATRFFPLNSSNAEAAPGASRLLKGAEGS